ncbi:MAG: nitroreductase [Firmicutes bacterium]|nr:nitroreductase [Bacillota bacterium]
MNEIIKAMKERRSIRKYKSEQIKDTELEQILEAGLYAASGRGQQATKLVVVQDKDTIARLSKMNAAVMGADTDPFYGAPTVITVFADRERVTCVEDGSLVIGNMMLAAHSIGVDSCWIHRAKEVFDSQEGKELMEEWGVDADYFGVGNCILGYRDCDYPAAPARKEGRIIRV